MSAKLACPFCDLPVAANRHATHVKFECPAYARTVGEHTRALGLEGKAAPRLHFRVDGQPLGVGR